MATVIECLTKLGNATDNDLVLWKEWESNSQHPAIDFSVFLSGNFSVALRPESVGTIVLYGPDGIKGQTSTGYSQLRTKVEANVARQPTPQDPPPVTSTLDELYAAIPG